MQLYRRPRRLSDSQRDSTPLCQQCPPAAPPNFLHTSMGMAYTSSAATTNWIRERHEIKPHLAEPPSKHEAGYCTGVKGESDSTCTDGCISLDSARDAGAGRRGNGTVQPTHNSTRLRSREARRVAKRKNILPHLDARSAADTHRQQISIQGIHLQHCSTSTLL